MAIDRAEPRMIVRGAAIGLIAGLVASFAMDRFQATVTALSSSDSDAEPATDKAASRIVETVTGRGLAKSARPLGGQIVHYALGSGLGALYGAAAVYRPEVSVSYGTAFGVGTAAVLDNITVPAAGLGDPPWKTSPATHAYALTSHLVFGAVMEFVRRRLDTMLPVAKRPDAGMHKAFGLLSFAVAFRHQDSYSNRTPQGMLVRVRPGAPFYRTRRKAWFQQTP